MPRGILEVHAAAAVVVVDLARAAAPRIGPVLQPALADAAVDRVELVLGDQEGVVLRADLLTGRRLCVVEAGAVVESYGEEGAELLWRQAGRRSR